MLYFYPKDDTPGCTLEGQEFTRLHDAFVEAGVDVYGVSPGHGEEPSAIHRPSARWAFR